MIRELRIYPAYKPSGVDWLGDVPAHWEVSRLKGHVANVTNLTNECAPDDTYIALENVESWTGRIREVGRDVDFDSQVKRFQVGDVLFGKLRPYLAKVTSPNCKGVCVGEFLVLRCRGDNCLPSYLERLMRSKSVIDAVNASTFGAKMPRADWQFIGSMKYPFPPLAEQRAIARYLDHVDRHIQRYIEAKEKLIALLQEARQSIIQRAVTRGLDPDVTLKPSGVEWLGDVPAHWEVRRLKWVSDLNPSRSEARACLNEDTPVSFLPMERVGTEGQIDARESVPASSVWNGFTYFRQGDVLVAKITPCFENGKGAYLGCLPTEIGFGSTEFHVLRAKPAVLPQFLYRLTALFAFRQSGADAMTGAAGQKRVPADFVANYLVPVPPLPEQHAIAVHLEKATAAINAAIDNARRQVELMTEYRASLIAHVVTGKLDVRAAAERTGTESARP